MASVEDVVVDVKVPGITTDEDSEFKPSMVVHLTRPDHFRVKLKLYS